MDCNVIKDLIPLYIDDCCSEESAEIVRAHIDSCSECKTVYESMNSPSEITASVSAPASLSRINDWKASILQSVLLFISFAVITVGAMLEASTPPGAGNGFWAFSFIVPATGFMLSLVNWYFVRLYKSKKSFSNCSLLATAGITACAYLWAGFHYEISTFNFAQSLPGISFTDSLNITGSVATFFGIGIFLTAVFCALSKILSNKYAKMLGKE